MECVSLSRLNCFSVSKDIGMKYARTRICVILCIKNAHRFFSLSGTNVNLCAEASKFSCINVHIWYYAKRSENGKPDVCKDV